MPLKTDGRGAWLEGGQTAALNAFKNRWPWWLAAKRCKALAWRLAEGFEGLEGGGFGKFAGLRRLRAGKRQTDGRGAWLQGWRVCGV